MMTEPKTIEAFEYALQGLMRRYCERVPDVQRVVDCMLREGLIQSWDDIENDHVAFRTMGVPTLGIASLEKVFLHAGYERREDYHFESKKLNAYWYSPPSPRYPRVFISELRVGDLSHDAQQIIFRYTGQVTKDPVSNIDLDDGPAVDQFLHQPLWNLPTWSDYQKLSVESEYAAWVLYNRYYLNHFTVSVHNLPVPFNTVEAFNALLERHGFRLNDAGGKIKVSGDGLLIQSSTVAAMVDAEFDGGNGDTEHHSISGSYVEFAERKILPEYEHLPEGQITRAHRRDGFETSNADKIFESTYSHQTHTTM